MDIAEIMEMLKNGGQPEIVKGEKLFDCTPEEIKEHDELIAVADKLNTEAEELKMKRTKLSLDTDRFWLKLKSSHNATSPGIGFHYDNGSIYSLEYKK